MTRPGPAATWPDPSRPGLPPEPDQDGHHVLNQNQTGPLVARWSARDREWWIPGATLSKSPDWAATLCGYVSRVRTDADLDAAYRKGVADARSALASVIREAEDRAAERALDGHRTQVLTAKRQGAEEMRRQAAEIAAVSDLTLMSAQFGALRDEPAVLTRWHRRLHAEAIHDLPLPGDAQP